MTHAAHDEHPTGLRRWVFTTNHKDIGTLYLVFAALMFVFAGSQAMAFRLELFAPGIQFIDPLAFNQFVTIHGLVMVFGAVMPAFAGLANWLIPMMIGAPDMALPRINNWGFWILPFAASLLLLSIVVPGTPEAGWTMYPPLSIVGSSGKVELGGDLLIFAVHLLGMSSILGAINIIVTILNMRCPGDELHEAPDVLLGVAHHGLPDHRRHAGARRRRHHAPDRPPFRHQLLRRRRGRRPGPVPAYLLVLRAPGGLYHHPAGLRDHLAYRPGVLEKAAVRLRLDDLRARRDRVPVLHRLGPPHVHDRDAARGKPLFMYTTILIAVPTGVKIFNWVSTMWKGSLSFEAPMLCALAFIMIFTVGGFTGMMLAMAPADYQYHDTYFVVSHFHYTMGISAIYAIVGAIYFWLPKWSGRLYDERLARIQFWISIVAVNVTFFPQFFLGLAGMPRRIPDYALQFADFNMLSSLGAWVFGSAQLLFLYIVLKTVFAGRRTAEARVWDGATGLEWTLPSPAPYHSFATPPVVH